LKKADKRKIVIASLIVGYTTAWIIVIVLFYMQKYILFIPILVLITAALVPIEIKLKRIWWENEKPGWILENAGTVALVAIIVVIYFVLVKR
jgi:4-hydroxybenzoate polyprenyltransferase